MSFADVWNTTYEGIPADAENIDLGANRIRDLKLNIRQRANTDHSWGDTTDNGRHNQVSFNLAAADPTSSSSFSFVYSKTAPDGYMELYYEDNAGRVTQMTTGGGLNVPPSFPSGTRLIFPQASPPAGWSFVPGWGDRVIRMVDDGTGGAAAGSWSITGLTTTTSLGSMYAASSSTSTSSGTASGTTDPHALTVDQLPGHQHNVENWGVGPGGSVNALQAAGISNAVEYITDAGNGLLGNAHSHTFTGTATITTTTTTTTGLGGAPAVSVAGDGTWRPAYGNAVLGQKN